MGDEKPMSASTGAIKKKKDDKVRRRDQRSWDNVLKSVGNMAEGEKISVIQERYKDIYTELRKTSSTLQVMERQFTVLQKEKDHTQAELTKHILAKSKLESLCRELQKQNKIIKDENITRVKEEEERRREVATSFTEKLNTLTALMDENKDKSVRLREENMSMTTKLTELYDQFQERESHLANMNRQLELQKKLSETQIKKLEVECENERQLWDKERQMLLSNLERSEQANVVLQENMKSLQEHLDLYKSQYSDFENTMQKSNRVFDAFKEEMTKMQRSNAALENERNEYHTRWQSCTNSILQISELHQQTSNELKIAERKVQMLEKLCRQLQVERAAYIQQLEENNIKPRSPSQPDEKGGESGASTSAAPTSSATTFGLSSTSHKKLMAKKEKMLVALKSELKVMEDQLKIASKQEASRKRATCKQESSVVAQAEEPDNDEIEIIMAGIEEQSSALTEETTLDDGSSAAKGIPIKKAHSCPLATEEHKQLDLESSSSSSIDDVLLTELSLEAIPLYKPEGVTDLTIYPKGELLVTEVEGRTNLFEEPLSTEVLVSSTVEETEDTEGAGAIESSATIPLKETDGKTEINKEEA